MMHFQDTYADSITVEITPTVVAIEVVDPEGQRVKRFIPIDEAVEICEAIISAARNHAA